ncbi:hypothetical protein [Microvirga puerhi]|uniref:SpoVG family protein n=1 Tax=Microvirga puerhi TaxID=2876078 RepID=A0ABS7VV06_9HYPH|nr:hypothetical protein [Microvirga puerhi]MBZ6079400.1 hypothetical protein [Microvirga puerhi]
MHEEVYSDGIAEITITGPIVRIDIMSLSPTERDAKNNPKPMFRQRIVMPVDAFANSVELMQKAMKGLIEAGAIKQTPAPQSESSQFPGNGDTKPFVNGARNSSPNFSS